MTVASSCDMSPVRHVLSVQVKLKPHRLSHQTTLSLPQRQLFTGYYSQASGPSVSPAPKCLHHTCLLFLRRTLPPLLFLPSLSPSSPPFLPSVSSPSLSSSTFLNSWLRKLSNRLLFHIMSHEGQGSAFHLSTFYKLSN